MAKNEFLVAITQLAAEKNLPKEVVFDAVETALASAYKKDALAAKNVVPGLWTALNGSFQARMVWSFSS